MVKRTLLNFEHRNDKTDKRKLRQLALDSLQSESDSSTVEASSDKAVSITEPATPPKTALLLPASTSHPETPKFAEKSSSAAEVSSEVSSISKEEVAWAGYEKDDVPQKTQPKYVRNLRHRIFTLYRRLFGVVFTVNMAIFIALCVKGPDAQRIGGIVIVNLFCAILMRQDYVINGFFNTFCSVPSSYVLTFAFGATY